SLPSTAFRFGSTTASGLIARATVSQVEWKGDRPWRTCRRTVSTGSARPHPPTPESFAADGPPGPAPPAKCSCTYQLADDRFRACRKDVQNISPVTRIRGFFRSLLGWKADTILKRR